MAEYLMEQTEIARIIEMTMKSLASISSLSQHKALTVNWKELGKEVDGLHADLMLVKELMDGLAEEFRSGRMIERVNLSLKKQAEKRSIKLQKDYAKAAKEQPGYFDDQKLK